MIIAVAGSTGLATSMNAGAEQIPESPGVTESASPETTATPPALTQPALTPPARLPWGGKPTRIQTGAGGASSRSLKSAGLDAAAPDQSGEKAEGEYAPKGRTTRTGVLKSAPTDVVPPKPPTVALGTQSVYFHYNVGSQAAVTEGAYANFSISKPTLATSDYHTLAEMAVQSADGNQIVEIGWNVDRVVNGDSDPHLFIFHWVNGQPTCYNGCGFVQYSQNIHPGDTLPQDVTKKLGIQYSTGAWWLAYDTEWVGYFPASLWSNNFTQSGMIQAFGEVAATTSAPCTGMGNGRNGASDTASARIGSVSYVNGPTASLYIRSTSDHYEVAALSGRTFRFGGSGAC